MWVWYAIAAAGTFIWTRRPTSGMWPYIGGCAALTAAVFFAATVSPRWFPLYAPRFMSTLDFLLAVPAGHAVAFVVEKISAGLGFPLSNSEQARQRTGITAFGIISLVVVTMLVIVGVRT